MKKLYCLLAHSFICLMLSVHTNAQTTIPVSITDTVKRGACFDNIFTAQFNAQGQHRISIHAFIDFSGSPYNSCTPLQAQSQVFIKFDTANIQVTDQQTDTTNGIWAGTIDTVGTVSLTYHVYIDCSVVSTGTSQPNINLEQVWIDSTANFNYDINNTGADTLESANLVVPSLTDASPLSYNGSYLNTDSLLFLYRTSADSAHIAFRFTPDVTNYNGQVTPISLQYKVGSAGNYLTLGNGVLTTADIPPNDTLFILRIVRVIKCIQQYTDTNSTFTWQCNNPSFINNIFCTECKKVYHSKYEIKDVNQPRYKIERLTPPDSIAFWDHSCLNDTSALLQWRFRITNPGVGALDTLRLNLTGGGLNDPAFLSLIPKSSFTVNSICTGCAVSQTITTRNVFLCSNLIDTALNSASIKVADMREGDTVTVSFRTFRCVEEDDISLLDESKFFNQWAFSVAGTDKCNNTALRTGPFPWTNSNNGISGHSVNGGADVDLILTFMPITNNLSIPPGKTFGDSAIMEVDMHGMMSTYDYQLLGASSTAGAYTPRGFLRAIIYCEKGLHIKNPATDVKFKWLNTATASYIYRNPVYYYTNIADTICDSASYYYYFNMADSAMLTFINSGTFEYKLQACCGGNEPASDYAVRFHLLLNPADSCLSLTFPTNGHTLPPTCAGTGCAWLPLSSRGSHIYTHCPGCKIPGQILDYYTLRRTTYGLQDNDNDGRADTGFVQVTDTSAWYNNKMVQSLMKPHNSSFGDELEDLMTSHFQEGDSTTGGYNYQQMLNLGVRLNYLQLQRNIPGSLDTFLLQPLEFFFYIDIPDDTTPNCIDCNGYMIDTLKYRTVHILHVPFAGLNTYMQLIDSAGRYFFTFESRQDTVSGLLTGNLHNGYVTDSDTSHPFTGFSEGQQYRMKMRYKECGNFMPAGTNNLILADVMRQSEISNRMWLSGKAQVHNAYGPVLQVPNTIGELYNAGWVLDSALTDSTHAVIDTTFANSYLFYCETFGCYHYFFSQDVKNNSGIGSDTACNKAIEARSVSRIAGNVIDIYPYEYRPPAFWGKEYQIKVPQGYHITNANIRNLVRVNGSIYQTHWHPFTPPSTIGTFTVLNSILSPYDCFAQNDTVPITATDTNQYAGSKYMERVLRFTLAPDSCNVSTVYPNDSSVMIQFTIDSFPCFSQPIAGCDSQLIAVRPIQNSIGPLSSPRPNLKISFSPLSITATRNHVCTSVSIQNPLTQWSANNYSTAAYNVYLAVPDSASATYLHNWQFTFNSGGTIFPAGEVFNLQQTLNPSDSITGQLCASYYPCTADSIILHAGWNCNGFPVSPFSADSVCNDTTFIIQIDYAPFFVNTGGKNHPSTYTLCDTFSISACFNSTQAGGIYPDSIQLDTLPPGLIVQHVLLYNCNVPYLTDTLTQININTWNITGGNMIQIGYPDSAISDNNCVCSRIIFKPECAFAGTNILPSIILNWTSYCGDIDATRANFTNTIEPDSIKPSACSDCFTLTKTALQDTVETGDTIAAFNIIICGNNDSAYVVSIIELLPNGFIPTSTIPATDSIPAQGCDTITVFGYFDSTGTCSSLINTVQIITPLNDTLTADTCITVLEPCAILADTIIPNGAFSALYGSGFTGITLLIEDTFFINNFFTITNCTVYTGSGATIILVQSQGTLVIDSSTTITGCTDMWRGIEAFPDTKLAVLNQSIISDADKGIYAHNHSGFNVINSSIIDCVKGIYTPADTSGNSIACRVIGSTFGLYAVAFNPDYPGQNPHGLFPETGIELNDMPTAVIGEDVSPKNLFYNLNTGITGFRSNIIVNNSEFYKVFADTAYNNSYDGTAMVCRGNQQSHRPGSLTVNPPVGVLVTVHDSYRGIYTNYSSLTVSFTSFINLHTGIRSRHCADLLTTRVYDCYIEASKYGIDWRFNAGAQLMSAYENQIIMSGDTTGIAINMEESNTAGIANYQINNNFNIDVISARHGIRARNVFNPVINHNTIKQHSSGIFPKTWGITLFGTDSADVQCNSVNCQVLNYSQSTGMHVGESVLSTIACNQFDSSATGIYFGGGCGGTDLKGNLMLKNVRGLYLNFMAVISKQKQKGNRWINYTGPYGAINQNISIGGLLGSEFDVNDTVGTNLYPYLPPFDSSWFVSLSGSAFQCGTTCDVIHEFTDDELEKLIAEGKKLSVDFIPESKNIAKEYLFQRLSEDSAFLASDSVYSIFYDDQKNKTIGKLYDVKNDFYAISWYDSLFKSLITVGDNLIEMKQDSIYLIDSLNTILGLLNYDTLRFNLTSSLNVLLQTRANLFMQRSLFVDSKISDADSKNNAVVPSKLPETNRQFMNQMQVLFEKYGEDIIAPYYSQILSIAQQCPYEGGSAVYVARTFIAMFNDEDEYDDDAVCLQSGIFREEKNNQVQTSESENSIIPNPADDKVTILLNGNQEGICKIEISNTLGSVILKDEMDCKEKSHSINTRNFVSGVYFVKVHLNKSIVKIAKLIIAR